MTVYLLVDIGPRIKKHPHTLIRPASEALRLMMVILMMVMERWRSSLLERYVWWCSMLDGCKTQADD